jgi:hypothetical protein
VATPAVLVATVAADLVVLVATVVVVLADLAATVAVVLVATAVVVLAAAVVAENANRYCLSIATTTKHTIQCHTFWGVALLLLGQMSFCLK